MKYVFDIDGTICNNTDGRYHDAKPHTQRINKINKLFEEGNIIIFHTARGMGSSNNNAIEAHNKWYAITEAQLKNWNVKYHLLVMGKPSGDLYIDDKGINDEKFF